MTHETVKPEVDLPEEWIHIHSSWRARYGSVHHTVNKFHLTEDITTDGAAHGTRPRPWLVYRLIYGIEPSTRTTANDYLCGITGIYLPG